MDDPRAIWSVSVSPRNPDARVVAQALAGVAPRERSALLLRWAAAYLQGKANDEIAIVPEFGMSEEDISSLLDGF